MFGHMKPINIGCIQMVPVFLYLFRTYYIKGAENYTDIISSLFALDTFDLTSCDHRLVPTASYLLCACIALCLTLDNCVYELYNII